MPEQEKHATGSFCVSARSGERTVRPHGLLVDDAPLWAALDTAKRAVEEAEERAGVALLARLRLARAIVFKHGARSVRATEKEDAVNEENREGTIESDEAEQPRRKIVTEVGPGQEATPVRVTARSGWPGGTIHPTERAYRFEVVEHTNGLDVRTWRYAIRADAQEMSDVAEWLALELERAQERIEELRVHGRARVRAEFYLGELLDIIDSTESLAEAALAAAHGYRCERAVAERHEKIVLEAYALLGKERPT